MNYREIRINDKINNQEKAIHLDSDENFFWFDQTNTVLYNEGPIFENIGVDKDAICNVLLRYDEELNIIEIGLTSSTNSSSRIKHKSSGVEFINKIQNSEIKTIRIPADKKIVITRTADYININVYKFLSPVIIPEEDIIYNYNDSPYISHKILSDIKTGLYEHTYYPKVQTAMMVKK